MMNLMWLLLISTIPTTDNSILIDRVDLVVVNHFHDDNAQLVLSQMVFMNWDESKNRHTVIEWKLLKSPSWKPRKNYTTGEYECVFWDGDQLRMVISKSCNEFRSQYDLELIERKFLDKEYRKGLSKPFRIDVLKP